MGEGSEEQKASARWGSTPELGEADLCVSQTAVNLGISLQIR